MRLAIVRQRYNPYGGAERFVERALRSLSANGLQITLIARNWLGESQHDMLRCDPFHIGRLWRDASFALCVTAKALNGRFDLVQSHERITGCDIYRAGDGVHATWLEQRGRLQNPVARLATRLHPWHRYVLATESRMFRDKRLRAVVCNSRMVRDDIAGRFGVPDGMLQIIYNGVDLEHFHPRLRDEYRAPVRARLGIDASAPTFLFVGSGFERKGVAALLQTLARLPEPRPHVLIVGEDRHRGRFERVATRLGVTESVLFLGGQKDVRPFYGAADAFVLPTLYDPMPNAALEALACGLPIVTSTTCGAAELISQGEAGYVCDALDIDALAANLLRLSQPGIAAAMAGQARAAAAGLSLDAMAEQLIALYRSLLR